MILVILCLTYLGFRNNFEEPQLIIREIGTGAAVVMEKGFIKPDERYIIISHELLHGYGKNERILVDNELVWNLIEEDREYGVTYKLNDEEKVLTEIWHRPQEK
jgi:hypothetical protein